MGSPPAPSLANGWLFCYDLWFRDDAKVFSCYMDDIIRSSAKSKIEAKLQDINSMHPSFKFTLKVEQDREMPFFGYENHTQGCRLA